MYLGLLRPLSLRGGLLRVRNLVRGALPMQKPARAGVQLRLGAAAGCRAAQQHVLGARRAAAASAARSATRLVTPNLAPLVWPASDARTRVRAYSRPPPRSWVVYLAVELLFVRAGPLRPLGWLRMRFPLSRLACCRR